jgi:transposase
VILPGGRFQVSVATRPVDFRKGMDSLAAVVQERLRLDPFSGAVFVFRAKRADLVQSSYISGVTRYRSRRTFDQISLEVSRRKGRERMT